MNTKRSVLQISLVLLVALGAGHMVQNMQKNLRDRDTMAASGFVRLEQVVAGPAVAKPATAPLPAHAVISAAPAVMVPTVQTEMVSRPSNAPALSDDQSALSPVTSQHAAGSST